MKRILVCSLMASGLLLANHKMMNDKSSGNPHLNSYERRALATSSPKVHVGGRHHRHAADRIEKNKTTINAFVPYGK